MKVIFMDQLDVEDLTETERVQLLQELLDHIGRKVEVTRWDDGHSRVNLVKPERW